MNFTQPIDGEEGLPGFVWLGFSLDLIGMSIVCLLYFAHDANNLSVCYETGYNIF